MTRFMRRNVVAVLVVLGGLVVGIHARAGQDLRIDDLELDHPGRWPGALL